MSAEEGETRVSPNGYEYMKTSTGKWELTHRVLMERKLGRPLKKNERVTFRDLDRTNIVIENLVLRDTNTSSARRRLAKLEERRDAIDAEIKEVQKELKILAELS